MIFGAKTANTVLRMASDEHRHKRDAVRGFR